MYCNIVFMIDIFVISKITQYRYYVIAITDVRSLGLSTKWRTLMIKKTMKVRENTFRKLEDPFENGAAKKYVFYVKVDDVAEGIPMATNPRDQKLTSGVATAIKESLLSNDGYFHLKNRGIVLSAESVHYNNKEKIATIIFSDELSHGNIDGGHTYKIVCEHKGENLEQYVQFEVMTGVEDIIENLAEARNTSVQVDAKSMAELAEKFDPIKEGLEGMPFFKRIAFKQNQISVDDETGKKNKMIDAREIVAIISMFNISLYDALHHPTQAYSSKAKMLDMYLKNPEEYREYVNIMPDIFDLYDAVEMEFADAYNAGGGRYGRKKYAGYKDGKIVAKSKFGLNKMQYKVPDIVHTIYVEMKNKHNTMNSASSAKTYIKMQGQILEDDDCACLLVEAIAKKSQNIKWSTKVDGKNVQHRLIRRVSMDQFYAILTGEEDAFYKMCMALPEVINSVVNEEGGVEVPHDTVIDELRKVASLYGDENDELSMAMAVYMLGFNTYMGFGDKIRGELGEDKDGMLKRIYEYVKRLK